MSEKLAATQKMKLELMKNQEFEREYAIADEEAKLALAIRKKRESLGLTQKEVSEQTGIKQAEISKIENNNANPTIMTLLKLGKVLGISLEWIDTTTAL